MRPAGGTCFGWRGLTIDTANPDVYPPKPASLLLAEVACDMVKPGEAVLDACTGSGIVGIALARWVDRLSLSGTDLSPLAIAAAKQNAVENGVTFILKQGDLYSPFHQQVFDVIVVHPPAVPYPRDRDWGLSRGMRLATDGGPDGSDVVVRAIRESRCRLGDGGRFLLLLPHWSNYRKAHEVLKQEFGAFESLAERTVEFFPALEGTPTTELRGNMKQLAASGIIEMEFSGSIPTSKVSVVYATRRV